MGRHHLFVLGWLIVLFSGCSSTLRSRAFGLLNYRHLEQGLHLVSDAPRLGVRRLRHVSQEHCCRHNVLACSRETADGLLRLCVSDDLPMYLSSSFTDTSARRVKQVLLKDLLEQDEVLTVFIKFCLELS